MTMRKAYFEAPDKDIIPEPVNLCPECGVDWDVLRESLKEPPILEHYGGFYWTVETENHAIARFMIQYCPECEKELGDML